MANALDKIGAALRGPVRALANDFGCIVSVYRKTKGTPASDGKPTFTYVLDATLTNVSALHELLNTATVQRRYGQRSNATAQIAIPRTAAGVDGLLAPGDGVAILSGQFTGWKYIADADSRPEGTGTIAVTPLSSAAQGLF